MRSVLTSGVVVLASLFAIACGGDDGMDDTAAIDSATVPPATAMAPDATAASFAGTWDMWALSETGDSLTATTMMATADTATWMVAFPGRDPMPTRVLAIGGDSVVYEFGPYESVLRPGVTTTTRGVNRMVGNRLTGSFEARYVGAGSDSVLRGRMEGMRRP